MDDKQRLAIVKRLISDPSDIDWLMGLCERQQAQIEETLRDIVELLTAAKKGGLVDFHGLPGRKRKGGRR